MSEGGEEKFPRAVCIARALGGWRMPVSRLLRLRRREVVCGVFVAPERRLRDFIPKARKAKVMLAGVLFHCREFDGVLLLVLTTPAQRVLRH